MLDEGKDRTEGNSKFPVRLLGWMPQVSEISNTAAILTGREVEFNSGTTQHLNARTHSQVQISACSPARYICISFYNY